MKIKNITKERQAHEYFGIIEPGQHIEIVDDMVKDFKDNFSYLLGTYYNIEEPVTLEPVVEVVEIKTIEVEVVPDKIEPVIDNITVEAPKEEIKVARKKKITESKPVADVGEDIQHI